MFRTILQSEVIAICECVFQNIDVSLQLGNLIRARTWLRMPIKFGSLVTADLSMLTSKHTKLAMVN